MLERELMLRSLTPLVLHADRSRAQFTAGLDYIPGSTLRGALAASYLQFQDQDADFQRLFVDVGVHFSDMLLATEHACGQLLPATARACKRYGLKHRDSLTDSLLRLECFSATQKLAPLKDPTWEYCPNPECRNTNKRDRVVGYTTLDDTPVRVNKRLLTGVSINRATGTAESGMLFSQEALEEGQLLRGVLCFVGEQEAELSTRFESILPVGTRLRIGAARSRGLGLVKIVHWGTPAVGSSLVSRWERMQHAVERLWQHYEMAPTGMYFSVTLTSHMLLRDHIGRPVTHLAERSDVNQLWGLDVVELRRHVLLPIVARGWNAQQGLPKEDEPALGRGSVLLFRVDPGRVTAVQERLVALEAEGLGRRRSEGFGRVSVCDPFHVHAVLHELG